MLTEAAVEKLIEYADTPEERNALIDKHHGLLRQQLELDDDIENNLQEAGQPLLDTPVGKSSMVPTLQVASAASAAVVVAEAGN
jgi:hypothetical protein